MRGSGGWVQLRFQPAYRLTFNFFGGQEDDFTRDFEASGIGKNPNYGANAIYRLIGTRQSSDAMREGAITAPTCESLM